MCLDVHGDMSFAQVVLAVYRSGYRVPGNMQSLTKLTNALAMTGLPSIYFEKERETNREKLNLIQHRKIG